MDPINVYKEAHRMKKQQEISFRKVRAPEYTVGQRVAYCTSKTHFSAAFIKFDEVTKVTKSGQVTLSNGMRFAPTGNQRKTKDHQFPSCRLINLKNAEGIIERAKVLGRTRKAISDLLGAIDNRRSGDGNYHFEEELVERIEDLAKALKKG